MKVLYMMKVSAKIDIDMDFGSWKTNEFEFYADCTVSVFHFGNDQHGT